MKSIFHLQVHKEDIVAPWKNPALADRLSPTTPRSPPPEPTRSPTPSFATAIAGTSAIIQVPPASTSPAPSIAILNGTLSQQSPYAEGKKAHLPVIPTTHQRKEHVPKFHFPKGRPISPSEAEVTLKKAQACFTQFAGGKAQIRDMPAIMKAADLPLYWKRPVFNRCVKVSGGLDFITFNDFKKVWEKIARNAYDEAARFVYYLAGEERDWLMYEDFIDMIQDIIDTHPGLTFLRDVSEFHNRYIQTVANCFNFFTMFLLSRAWQR